MGIPKMADPTASPMTAKELLKKQKPNYGWPQLMKRATAAAYCDVSEGAFVREVLAGRVPGPINFGGREHWHKEALDGALNYLVSGGYACAYSGEVEEVPEYRRKLRESCGIKS